MNILFYTEHKWQHKSIALKVVEAQPSEFAHELFSPYLHNFGGGVIGHLDFTADNSMVDGLCIHYARGLFVLGNYVKSDGILRGRSGYGFFA